MAEYRFVTHWRIEAPLHQVFDAIFHSLHWPEWWQGAEKVEERVSGDAEGVGNVRRYTWKSRLAYRLTFDAHTTRIEPQAFLEATASGDLEGVGRWFFSHDGQVTTVRYEWLVRTTKPWMNLLASGMHVLFKWNHHALMQRGGEGLVRLLNARLVDISHTELPLRPDRESALKQ